MNSKILQYLNKLYVLSSDSALLDGRYLTLKFDGSDSARVDSLVVELQSIAPSRLAMGDIERDATGYISSICVKKSNLNVFVTYRELVNTYFSLAVKGELATEVYFEFFLIEKQLQKKSIFARFKALQDWIIWLKDITGNYHVKDNDTKIMFYLVETIEDDKKVKTHELSLGCADIMDCLFDIKDVPPELNFGGDANYVAEKKLIAKSALIKTIKSTGVDFSLPSVLSNSSYLLLTFQHNYEFYIQKFSIDRFIREIEIAKIEYFEKINAIIHDNQAKALSIPVVLLGTSLLRSWNFMAAILIFTAMLLALYLVILNLNYKKEAINDCTKSAKRALENINEITNYQNAMPTSSRDTDNVLTQIEKKATDAIKLLNNIILGIICAAFVWLIYMACFYLHSSGSCPLS